jgi:hypothetical protein
MNEHIHYFDKKDFYEEYFKFLSKYCASKFSKRQNNNDTLNILLSSFLYLKSFVLSLQTFFNSHTSSMHKFIYKLEFILLLLVSLFSLVMTFEENSEVPTQLIIGAYFPRKRLTRISYDMIQDEPRENENKNKNYENIDFEDINKLIKEQLNKNKDNKDNSYINTCEGDTNSYENRICKCKDRNNINNKINSKQKEELTEDLKTKNQMNAKNKQKQKNIFSRKDISDKDKIFIVSYYNSFKYIVICLSFLLLYFFIKFTINTRIKGSLIFNIICIIIAFNLLYTSYKNEFYLGSNFIFILLIYIDKNLIDSIYLKLQFKRKDFEIFSTSLMAFNSSQFHLKCILLLNMTILSGVLSIFFFKSFLNYIMFYICLFTLIVFLSNCVEPLMPYYLKQIKNIIIFVAGFLNLVLSKSIIRLFINENHILTQMNYFKKYFNNYDITFENDSLYFVSDLFSLFCLDYIREYLEWQININIMFDNYIENNNDEIINNKIHKEESNQFGAWIIFLWISMFIGVIGIFKKEYICLIISIYLVKILMNFFCNLYDVKISKIFFYVHSFLFIFIFLDISFNENKYLVNLFFSFTNIDKDILSFILKLITLLFFAYYVIVINLILYNTNSNKYKYEKEIKIKKDNNDLNVYHIEIENVQIDLTQKFVKYFLPTFDCSINYLIICLLIKINQDYETSIILKGIYTILAIVFYLSKTANINKINDTIDYLSHFFIWFLFSIRLADVSSNIFSLIYLINHLNLIIHIIVYFLNEKRNIFFTILLIFFLIVAHYHFNSYMFLFDVIILIGAFIVINIINKNMNDENENDEEKNKEEKEKKEENGNMNVYNSLSLLFLLPILIFFLLQLKFQNYFNIFSNIDKYIKEFLVQIYILYDNDENKDGIKEEPIEMVVIAQVIDAIKILSSSNKNN